MYHDVVLYSTNCPRCKILERKLDTNHIDYYICDDVHVMEQLGIISVPMLSIDGKLLTFGEACRWADKSKEEKEF